MRVGPRQEQVLKWLVARGERFWISEVASLLDVSYDVAEGAVRKLHNKGFVALVREPRLGTPNLYEVTQDGRLWLNNFGGR